MYELDTIYHCKAETLLTGLDDACIDLIVTSPPYDNLRIYNGFSWDFELIARESYRVLKPGGVLVWIVKDATIDGDETLTSFEQALYFKKHVGFKMWQRMVWQKGGLPQIRPNAYLADFEDMFVFSKDTPKTFNPIMRRNKYAGDVKRKAHMSSKGFGYSDGSYTVAEQSILTNVWAIGVGFNKTTSDDIDHPAMFPEALAERHILSWSNPGDVVLDYFMGSGTTAKMARANGRRYLGCDISAEYVALANKRLSMPYTLPMLLGEK